MFGGLSSMSYSDMDIRLQKRLVKVTEGDACVCANPTENSDSLDGSANKKFVSGRGWPLARFRHHVLTLVFDPLEPRTPVDMTDRCLAYWIKYLLTGTWGFCKSAKGPVSPPRTSPKAPYLNFFLPSGHPEPP